MASPQPTPFVRFSKELFEAFYQNPPATVAACRIWLWVMRWTYADFGKVETKERSLGQIAAEVGLSRASACRELQALIRCRRLKMGKDGGYAIQKDYDLWRDDTKKRVLHFGNRMRQERLFSEQLISHGETVDKKTKKGDLSTGSLDEKNDLSTDLSTVSHGETPTVSHGEINRFTVEQSGVSPSETPIRSKNTVENREKGRGNGARPAPQVLPNGKKDTPTERARLGSWEHAPQDHPGFTRLSFPIQTALADQWRETAEAERKRTACKKCNTRTRASDAWAYCRPCTVCRVCAGAADGTRKFQTGPEGVICTKCVGDLSKEF